MSSFTKETQPSSAFSKTALVNGAAQETAQFGAAKFGSARFGQKEQGRIWDREAIEDSPYNSQTDNIR